MSSFCWPSTWLSLTTRAAVAKARRAVAVSWFAAGFVVGVGLAVLTGALTGNVELTFMMTLSWVAYFWSAYRRDKRWYKET
jgi:hypothetical protein